MNRSTLWTLAIGCAVSVGNLYYIQPLLAQISRDFHVSAGQAGIAATLAQVGYAAGMLLIVPLGDMIERRRLVLLSIIATTAILFVMAGAPSFPVLLAASLGIGFATVTPQLLIPFAASLADQESRGRVVGFVMSGLLVGILLARTVSGVVAAHFGWRVMYFAAAGVSVVLGIALRLTLPESKPTHSDGFRRLFLSMIDLIREEPVLRESAVFGAMMFAAFSAFWTTLSFLLARAPFHYKSDVAGYFGIVGLVGVLAAPLVGRFADRGSPRTTIGLGMCMVGLSYLVFSFSSQSLIGLVLGVILLDLGTQSSHVSNQSRIFSIRPEARSRMNTVYMTSYFVGGSMGSAFAAWSWSVDGWLGVCMVGGLCAVFGLGRFALSQRRQGALATAES